MRYLINRKTNEHERYDGQNYDATKYRIVEADSEGWIPHTGNECPLPYNHLHEVKDRDGGVRRSDEPQLWDWYKDGTPSDITHYRPILAEKVQEAEPTKPKRLFDDLLERLEASHNAAQALPDLVAQLRDRLKPLGLGVMYLSEFDAVQPEPDVKTPQGYVLMPLEPTEAMLDAMHDNCFANPEWRKMCGYQKGEEIYKELLAHSRPKGEK